MNEAMEDICPFIQKECLFSKCMLFNSNDGCVFETTAFRLKLIEEELKSIKSKIGNIDSKID